MSEDTVAVSVAVGAPVSKYLKSEVIGEVVILSVGVSVAMAVGDSVKLSVGASVWTPSLGLAVGEPVMVTVGDPVTSTVGAHVGVAESQGLISFVSELPNWSPVWATLPS